MPYNDDETSNTDSRPIELFSFLGTFNDYYMTSYSLPIVSSGRLYVPTTLKRSQLKVGTQEQTDSALEIEIPFDNPMVLEYAYDNAPPSLVMKMRRCHESNYNDTALLWTGRVTGFSVDGRISKLRVPSLFSYILEGNTPTPRFQAPCNHVLYDSRCGVNPALHQHIATVTSIVGNQIAVNSLPFSPGEGAAGVMISNSGEQRMIISNVGTSVTVTYGFSSLNVGDTITLRKGCDHSFEGHCKTRFSNGPRFGGFPLVPDRNPFTSTLA